VSSLTTPAGEGGPGLSPEQTGRGAGDGRGAGAGAGAEAGAFAGAALTGTEDSEDGLTVHQRA